ncbi:DUF3761 domain-containing protein [Moraxella boevrei]|uniref:DUF3761 domain-containing protein n=1 Tax=Faucicola boevrei TaxID=346665 RepID=UPI0037361254
MSNWFIGIVIFVSILAILDYSDKQQSGKYDATNYNNSYSTKTTYDKSQNATALCRDGTYSYSANRRGTCSHHGGVKYWLNDSQSIPTTTLAYTHTSPKSYQNYDYIQPVQNPFTTTEPTQYIQQNEQPQPTLTVEQAKQMYEQEVANINQAWQDLDPSVRKNLRPEQRIINKQRESECTAYGQTQSNVSEIQQAYRYLCEVPKLKERTQYLQENKETKIVLTPILETLDKPNKVISQPNPPMTLEQAKKAYEEEVHHINQVWKALDSDIRENIRIEQRQLNNEREYHCKIYGQSQSTDIHVQATYRYLCEIPLLQERTKYLKSVKNSTVFDVAS